VASLQTSSPPPILPEDLARRLRGGGRRGLYSGGGREESKIGLLTSGLCLKGSFDTLLQVTLGTLEIVLRGKRRSVKSL